MKKLKRSFDRLTTVGFVSIIFSFAVIARAAPEVVTKPQRTFGLGDVSAVAVSPDGRYMASGGQSGAFLWDFESGSVRHRLDVPGGRVLALCFSPDNRVLLSGGFDRTIRAWEVESGTEIGSFAGHQGQIMDLTFAPDGQSFVSTGDNSARVWSLATGELLKLVTVPGSFLARAVFTPDGHRLVTSDGSPTNNVRVWDLASGQTLRSFGANVRPMGFVAGGHLVTGGSDFILHVWNLETGEEIRAFPGATQSILELSASTKSSTVIAACQDGRLIEWDSATGTVLHNTTGDWLTTACGMPGTNQMVMAHSDNAVRLQDVATGTTLRAFEGHTTSTTSGVAFSPDGRHVLSGGAEAATRLWNRTNAQLVRTFVGHGAGTAVAVFSPDGTRVLTTRGYPQPMVQMWNAATGQLEREFGWTSGWPTCAAFSKDGSHIAAGDQNGTLHLWPVTNNANPRILTGVAPLVTALAFSPDRKRFASGGSSYRPVVNLWDLETGASLRTFELEAGSVIALDFSPSGAELLVAWEDGYIRLFNVADGGLRREIVTPAAYLNDAVFSPDGRFILTGEGWPYFTAAVWDAVTGQRLRVFGGHTTSVDSVAFSPTGDAILTGSDAVRLWSIADIAARLQCERKPGGLELRWNLGVLQYTADANGPWLDITNAASPWTVSTDEPSSFFRVHATAAE